MVLDFLCGRAERRLFCDIERNRRTNLEDALRKEVHAVQTKANGDKSIHSQCIKDFDRAVYRVGNSEFPAGAAAAADEQTAGAKEKALTEFKERFEEECGSDLTHLTSALASQVSMAHLGMVNYSGPMRFSIPSGCTTPKFIVQRGKPGSVVLDMERVTQNFEEWSIPLEEPRQCHKSSIIRQHARVILCSSPDRNGDVDLDVEAASEEMRLLTPQGRPMRYKGFPLVFQSPPPADSTKAHSGSVTFSIVLISFSVLYAMTHSVLFVLVGLAGGLMMMGRRALHGQDVDKSL